MRDINADVITEAVARLCIEANTYLPQDVRSLLDAAALNEPWQRAKRTLETLKLNYEIARDEKLPICQDTGMACVFLKIGQDVHITGNIERAVNEGVRQGYAEGFLRMSIVGEPVFRSNTGDNTPAMLYIDLVEGDKVDITVAPKGFGSENKSRLKMLKPSDGEKGIVDFVLETVEAAGADSCPPVIVGVGIGGNFDKAALLAKKALLRDTRQRNADKYYSALEKRLLELINSTGIGPEGLGGATTALAVNIEVLPTHIAGLPVAVNMGCHATRHASEVL